MASCTLPPRPWRGRDRRRLVLPVLLVLAILGPAPTPVCAASTGQDARAAVPDPLDVRTSIDVRGGDLEGVLDQLRTRHALNLVVDWTALDARGLDRTTRIDLQLRDVTVRSALDLVLMAAGAGEEIQWATRDGVITIGAAGAASTATLKVYDVADLVANGFSVRRRLLTPVVALEPTGLELVGGLPSPESATSSGRSRASGSLFGGGAGVEMGPDMDRMQELIDLVQELVARDSWESFGGDVGTMRVVDRRLMIQQSERAHRGIAALLELLRETRPAPVALDVALVAMRVDRAAAWRAADAAAFPRLSAEDAAHFFEDEGLAGLVNRATTIGRLGDAIRVGGLRQTPSLRRLTPVPAASGEAMLLRADLEMLTSGLEVIVRPMRVPGQSMLRAEVDVAWQPRPVRDQRSVPGLPGGEASLDAFVRTLQQVSASADLGPGEGLALSLPAPPDGVLDRDASELFVIIRIRPEPEAPTTRPDAAEDDDGGAASRPASG